ncbi:hypothetical protein GCK32_013040 [Trichostrongylus colubriformis]|uniref:Uncharacterized protein n=1 Tax=Trichostrongylus colubriformis TaxID=6319 RepID=A0AAN8FJT0_TRICO
MEYKRKLREAEEQLKELQYAIPPLPAPAKLCDHIINYCCEFRNCMQMTAALETQLGKLRMVADSSFGNQIHEAELLELQCENLRLRMVFVRGQLRTLFLIPPLLIAQKRLRETEWEALMESAGNSDGGEQLLTDRDEIERVATDQLQALSGMQTTLRNIRQALQGQQRGIKDTFEQEMRDSVTHIQSAIFEVKETILAVQARLAAEGSTEQKERSIIGSNALFMEELQTDDSDSETGVPMEEGEPDAAEEEGAPEESFPPEEELLAQYCNILQTLVDKSEGSSMKNGGTSWDPVQSQRIQATVWELGATSKLVNETLASFTAAVDSLSDPLSEERNRQVEEGIEKTLLVLQRAQKLAIELEANRISARDHASTSQEATGTAAIAVARPKLPAIPVPIFTGKVWDFENFWALFAANVHNQPLTPLQKFNYLVNALRGEARESIRRFAITEANYEHAIEFLRRKYGDESRLICCLQSRLEDAKASDTSLLGQRRLLEQLLQIVTQLEEKGVTLVGSFLTQKILAKFTSSIQRKVLEQRMTLPMQENNWRMRDILTDIDRIIDMEERINRMVQNPGQDNRKRSEASRGFKTQKQQGYGPYMEYKRKLREAEEQLKELQYAIPPLPAPAKLCDHIINYCCEFRNCMQMTAALETQLGKLRMVADSSFGNQIHEAELLELQCENLRLRMVFVRGQLRTLFLIPPLLIAQKRLRETEWEALMESAGNSDGGEQLLTDRDEIERVATDQLQALSGMQTTLRNIRQALQGQQRGIKDTFEQEMRDSVTHIQSAIFEVKETILAVQARLAAEGSTEQKERSIIGSNALFMEELQTDDSDSETGVPMEEGEPDAAEEEGAPEESFPPEVVRRNNSVEGRLRNLEDDIEMQRAAIRECDELIEWLEKEPICPPRNFEQGGISRGEEKFMRCAFCEATGRHYSDSCVVVRLSEERRQVLLRKRRCTLCLEKYCPGNRSRCPKYFATCHHCRFPGHHSAICELPERSQETWERLQEARNNRHERLERLRLLQRIMRSLRHHG